MREASGVDTGEASGVVAVPDGELASFDPFATGEVSAELSCEQPAAKNAATAQAAYAKAKGDIGFMAARYLAAFVLAAPAIHP